MENRDGNLPKLFEVHDAFFIFLVCMGIITVYVQILEEKVVSLNSILTISIDSEDEVDPIRQSLGNYPRLKTFSHPKHKLILILGPSRQCNIINYIFVLPKAQVILIPIF